MTYLQLFQEFKKVCPIDCIKDWRPFGKDSLCIWFTRSRKFMTVKATKIGPSRFTIEPCEEEDWVKYNTMAEAMNLPNSVGDSILPVQYVENCCPTCGRQYRKKRKVV